MRPATFAIVMPAYNAEKTIADSIFSVLNQYYRHFKLYIVNDHSIDNTLNIIKNFTDKRIVYLENPGQRGVANARNVALDIVTEDYIAFLDSDDLWLPDKLSRQLPALRMGHDLVFSFYYTFRHTANNLLHCRRSPQIISRDDLLKTNHIGNLTGIYNAKHTGIIRQKNIGHEDYLMWLEVIDKTKMGYCVQHPLALYRLSPHSLSGNKCKAAYWQWNIYRHELKFPFGTSLYYFSHYAQKAISKRLVRREGLLRG